MITTILLSVIMMLGLFLMLWSEVGFIQEKKFASSCPKEELDLMPDTKPERFKGQHALGWIMAIFAVVLMAGALIFGALNGIRNGYTFGQFFMRFIIMLLLVKAFDIIFFDWVLLCNRGFGFFTHYYPEVEPALTPKLFGYNKKSHLKYIIGVFPVSAVLAWLLILI